MNLPTFPKPKLYASMFYALVCLTVCAGVAIAVFVDQGGIERIDALSSGPYVVERIDDITGTQLFAMPDEDAWTADIGFAQRYGTMTQAGLARDKIGAGHVAIVREVVR